MSRYPDPASLPPGQLRGVRLHQHEPDQLHPWVFTQGKVWVDTYGHEHDLCWMSDDYLENVLAYCEERSVLIHFISCDPRVEAVAAADVSSSPTPSDPILAWLESTPLIQAVREQLADRARKEPAPVGPRARPSQLAGWTCDRTERIPSLIAPVVRRALP